MPQTFYDKDFLVFFGPPSQVSLETDSESISYTIEKSEQVRSKNE